MGTEIYKIGDRFNDWTLLERLPPNRTSRRWRCRCACGTVQVVYAQNVTSGRSKGCRGCVKRRLYR